MVLKAMLLALAVAEAGPPPAVIPLGAPMSGLDDLNARINGQEGLFLFDSGSGVSQLTPSFAHEIGCTPWGKLTGFRARGERGDGPHCNAMLVDIGPVETTVSEPLITDLVKMLGSPGKRFSGVIALDAFAGQVVTISLARKSLVVETPDSLATIVAHATEVPIRLVRDAQGAALSVDMGVPTRLGMLWMEIDTGNPGPISVDKTIATLLGLNPNKTGPQTLDAPLAGQARLLGPAEVGDFIFDGNLGRGFLLQLDVTLDLAHSRCWITPAISSGRINP